MRTTFFASNLNETVLSGELSDQPWINYQLGQGINALTGSHGVSGAIIPFSIDTYPELRVQASYSMVSSQHEFERLVSASAQGQYNMGTTQLSGSSEFLDRVTYSETSLTVLVVYDVATFGIGNTAPSPLTLTTDAADYLNQQGGDAFRDRYGDYFVSSQVAGSRFVGVYTIHTTSSSSLLDIKASAKMSANMVSAEGAAAFSNSIKDKNVRLECEYLMYGVKEVAPSFDFTPEGIAEALKWFVEKDESGNARHIGYIPLRAQLTHFSKMSSKISNRYDVSPEVFSTIQVLRLRINQLTAIFKNLPDYYGKQRYTETVPAQKSGWRSRTSSASRSANWPEMKSWSKGSK